MKKLVILLVVLALVSVAQANILTNGDFSLGENDLADAAQPNDFLPTGWDGWNGGGWNKRETEANGNGTYGSLTDYHLVLGASQANGVDHGRFQIVPATEGLTYKASVDAGSTEAWWRPNGELKIEFLDAAGLVLDFAYNHWDNGAGGLDNVVLAWANYSVTATAPVGTTQIKYLLMHQGVNGDNGDWYYGGNMRFDNADLSVVPEPATMVILGLGGLFLRRRK